MCAHTNFRDVAGFLFINEEKIKSESSSLFLFLDLIMLKLQGISSNLLKKSLGSTATLSTTSQDLHYSSRGKNWRKHYDPGYFYDGVDLGPSVGRVNIRDFKYDKYCARNLTRLRLVDNSKLSVAAMEYRK